MTNLCELETQIPEEYRNFEIDQMIGDPSIVDPIKMVVKDYLTNLLDNEKNGSGLLFYGTSNGTGKTELAYYILANVQKARNKWSRVDQQETIGYTNITAIRTYDYLKACSSYDVNSVTLVQQVKSCPFLLLDELSPNALKNSLAPGREELASLVDYRVRHNLPTIYTSNCESLEALKKLIDPTLYSRITYKTISVNFTGRDVRPLITEQLKEELLNPTSEE